MVPVTPRYSRRKISGMIARSSPTRLIGSLRLYEVREDLSAQIFVPLTTRSAIARHIVTGLCSEGIDETFPANDPSVLDIYDDVILRGDEPCLWEPSP